MASRRSVAVSESAPGRPELTSHGSSPRRSPSTVTLCSPFLRQIQTHPFPQPSDPLLPPVTPHPRVTDFSRVTGHACTPTPASPCPVARLHSFRAAPLLSVSSTRHSVLFIVSSSVLFSRTSQGVKEGPACDAGSVCDGQLDEYART